MIPHGNVLVLDTDGTRARKIALFLNFFGYSPRIHEPTQHLDDQVFERQSLTGVIVVGPRDTTAVSGWLEALETAAPEVALFHWEGRADQTPAELARPKPGTRGLFPTGKTPAIRSLVGLIRQVAPFNTSVLILGESGTGKERVARSIHAHSDRSDGVFVPVNCGAIPLS